MSCDAPNGFRMQFWTFLQVLSPFGAKQFFRAQNELWCTKWLQNAILNVLASFEPIRSETIFSSSEWVVMHQMSSECNSERFCKFWAIRSETIFSSSEWVVMHQMASECNSERFCKFWAHSVRNNFFELRMSCDAPNGFRMQFWTFLQVLSAFGAKQFFRAQNELWCTKWLQNAILNVFASFERIRCETIFSSSEWVVMHQMASECNSERFCKFWAHSVRNNFFELRMSCDAPNGFRMQFWTFLQVLSPFGAKQFFRAQNELWCTKCLQNAILNVLASFEPIRSEKIFSSKWAVMHQMSSECNSERFSKFWVHSERNNFFELRMSCDAPNGFRMQFWTFLQVLSAFGAKQFFRAQNELWCTKWLQNAILNVFASFERIRCETIFSSSEWVVMHQMASECNSERFCKFWAHSVRNNFFELRMSCDAPNGFRMQFWTFLQVLSAFGAKQFFRAQNELWCTKWLQNAILNVLASFEPIRSETIFSSSEWVVMHQMASECNSERFSKFWAIRSETIFSSSEWVVMHQMASECNSERFSKFWAHSERKIFSSSEWAVMHQMSSECNSERFSKFWVHSERNNFFELRMSCDAPNGFRMQFWTFLQVLSAFGAKQFFRAQNELWCTKWLQNAILNVFASFERIRCETIFSSSEWVVMHQMASECNSERFSKFWAHSERNNFFELRMSCDAPNGFRMQFWTF